MKIIKIKTAPFAKMISAIGFGIGLLSGIFMMTFGLFLNNKSVEFATLSAIAGQVLSVIIIYGLFGYLFGLVFACLYNWLAPRIGSVEVEVTDE